MTPRRGDDVPQLPDMPDPTPADAGFRMPAEWNPHAATWTSWPFDDALWDGFLEGVRREFAAMVAHIARYEPVVLNVRDDEVERDARRRIEEIAEAAPEDDPMRDALERITFHRIPLNDVWFRDNGPIFIRDAQGRLALTDWTFNAWGGKYAPWDQDDRAPERVAERLGVRRFELPYVMEGGALEVNDQGLCLTTRSCLLSQERNPNLSENDVEHLLEQGLGVRHVVWLEGGLKDDHTDGHIDTIVRFTDDRTILCTVADEDDEDNFDTLARNLEALKTLRTPDGDPYEVLELPLPEKRLYLHDKRLPLTYANFYVGNGFVLVPVYDDPRDARALEIVASRFPDREVIGLPAVNLVTGGGAFHCVTQQQPRGELLPAGTGGPA